jgi:hypothetical protein
MLALLLGVRELNIESKNRHFDLANRCATVIAQRQRRLEEGGDELRGVRRNPASHIQRWSWRGRERGKKTRGRGRDRGGLEAPLYPSSRTCWENVGNATNARQHKNASRQRIDWQNGRTRVEAVLNVIQTRKKLVVVDVMRRFPSVRMLTRPNKAGLVVFALQARRLGQTKNAGSFL